MFHWADNLYFGRRPDGSVRILKLAATPPEFPRVDAEHPSALVDLTVPANEWASIVTSVSVQGETAQSFQRALELHDGPPRGVHHHNVTT